MPARFGQGNAAGALLLGDEEEKDEADACVCLPICFQIKNAPQPQHHTHSQASLHSLFAQVSHCTRGHELCQSVLQAKPAMPPPASSSASSSSSSSLLHLPLLLVLVLCCTTHAFLPPSLTSTAVTSSYRRSGGASRRSSSSSSSLSAASSSSRGGGSEPSQKEFFRLAQGKMEFGTVDEVELLLWEEPALIRRYLTERPDRVLLATWDAELVDRQARDVFRLTTKPMSFVNLNLQPSIDVRLTAAPPLLENELAKHEHEDGGQHLLLVESLAHSMNGMEQILGQRFAESLKIDVTGKLRAVPPPSAPAASRGVVLYDWWER